MAIKLDIGQKKGDPLVLLVPIRAFQEALFPLHPQMEDVWEKVLECALHRRGSELELEVFLLVFLRTSLAPNSDHWEIPTLSFFCLLGRPRFRTGRIEVLTGLQNS